MPKKKNRRIYFIIRNQCDHICAWESNTKFRMDYMRFDVVMLESEKACHYCGNGTTKNDIGHCIHD